MTEGPPPTRHGRESYEVISALQKAIRRSQVEQAAAFAIELTHSGLGAWCFARLKVIAVEDVSPEATGVVADVHALHEQWKAAKGKGDLYWLTPARAAVALALAPKSRLVDWLVLLHTAKGTEPVPIPDEALDQHTRAGRRMGRGRRHFAEEAGRLIEWDGDLATLEADVRQRALALWLKDESATGGTPEPGLNAEPEPPGQLKIEDDG